MSASRSVCFVVVLTLAFTLLAGNIQAATITLDDFSTGQPAVNAVGNATNSGSVAGGGILGGVREVTVANTGSPISQSTFIAGGGLGDFTTSAISTSGNLTLNYDGTAGLGGDLNVDLTGFSTLNVSFVAFDATSTPTALPVTLTLFDGTNTQFVTLNLNPDGNPVVFPRNLAFDLGSFGSVNLGSINSITLFFDAGVGQDFTLGGSGGITIQEVPEPASLTLWGALGVAGVWYARRRLVKKASAA